MTAFLYGRVSHQLSADSGLSMDEQVTEGLKYISRILPNEQISRESFASPLPGLFLDNPVSGWRKPFTARPAGNALQSLLKPGDHVVCYSIDRLARNLRDFVNTTFFWQSNNIHIHYIADQINTTTAVGRLQAHMKAAMAQFTSDLISERTKEALAIKRMREGRNPFEGGRTRRMDWMPSEFRQSISTIPINQRIGQGTIYCYERVSSDRQYTSGLGLESQSFHNWATAKALANETGNRICEETFSDNAVSAFRVPFDKRPAGKALLERLKPGDDVIFYRLDRAWRNPGEAVDTCQRLKERGVYVHFTAEGIRTDTAVGEEWIGLLASVAHLESVMRSRRVREAHARCRSNGRPIGQIPKGFKSKQVNDKQKLVLDHKAAVRLVAIWLLREEMELSSKEISDVIFAWNCRDEKHRATLKHRKEGQVARKLKQAQQLKSRLTASLWWSLVAEAREFVEQPIDDKYWWMMRWDWPFNDSAASNNLQLLA